MPDGLEMPLSIMSPFTFRATHRQHCFQDILNLFPTARSVTIFTYNLDEHDGSILMQALQRLHRDCRLTIYHSIPSRYDSYYNDQARYSARRRIDAYLDALSFDDLPFGSRVFFCPGLHAKLIVADSTAYVGSANYSSASAGNIECGMIVRDKAIVDSIVTSMERVVERHAIQRVHPVHHALAIRIDAFGKDLEHLISNLEDLCTIEFDDIEQSTGWGLSSESMAPLGAIVGKLRRLFDDTMGEIDFILGEGILGTEVQQAVAEMNIGRFHDVLAEHESIDEYANFDEDSRTSLAIMDSPPGDEETFDSDLEGIAEGIFDEQEALREKAEVALEALINDLRRVPVAVRHVVESIARHQAAETAIDNTVLSRREIAMRPPHGDTA